MGRLGIKSDYESLRDARISENMARMEMLGLRRCAGELSDIASAASHSAAGSATPRKAPRPRVMSMTPLRRSGRLVAATQTGSASTCRRSARLNGQFVQHKALPPKGKTDCSSCHSSNGILCRACLKVRYGEEMGEVRKNKNWMCPHCIEEKGIKKFWICNSSFCLKRRKIPPTGIAIYNAREQGYESVAHLLMDRLKRQAF
ncbi:hypothetical protein BAE44_0019927 [Dichanthelium oligosanthes]|uniref:Zinc-finger domain-containing protein n=1 Tax=Dichanthelium oligosanthes TaxID=888268 RepID=A0A1E5V1L2_9POAL|nr:hypothetical protein BAE44_0019927 [Dichanthelium oligosanthes]